VTSKNATEPTRATAKDSKLGSEQTSKEGVGDNTFSIELSYFGGTL